MQKSKTPAVPHVIFRGGFLFGPVPFTGKVALENEAIAASFTSPNETPDRTHWAQGVISGPVPRRKHYPLVRVSAYHEDNLLADVLCKDVEIERLQGKNVSMLWASANMAG
jgi:hypothetical protein